jgi:hypothetical protein
MLNIAFRLARLAIIPTSQMRREIYALNANMGAAPVLIS